MAIKIKFDLSNNPMPLRLILATRSGNRIRELPLNEIKFHDTLVSGSEISFRVYKNRCVDKDGNIDESFWRRITDFKLAYCPEFDLWYELDVDLDESTETVKSVQATSLGEAELSQTNLYEMEINTEDDIAREDYKPTALFNAEDEDASLLHRMLKKAPHYRIAHVDASVANIQRTFEFNDKSIYDACQEIAEEINCLFRFDCTKGTNGSKIDRTVSVYDLESYCETCGTRGEFTTVCEKCGSTAIRPGYGKDTTVFVSRENLAQEVTFETDKDSVKNCFRLEAGDDLMTAAVVACNPNGSRYLWYIPDETKEDMSSELRSRLASYDALYDDYQNTHVYDVPASLVTQYNSIVNKYKSFDENLQEIPEYITGFPALMTAYFNTIDLQLFLNSSLMPNVEIASTDAATEAAKLTAAALSPVAVSKLSSCNDATASNAVLGVAKCLVRGSFQVKVNTGSYNATTQQWTGSFTVTNYSDEEDTAVSQTISVSITENLEDSIRQKIDKAMRQEEDEVTDISELFKLSLSEFRTELRKYSLQRLLAFQTACQAAIGILIQQGTAETTHELYNSLYVPYLDKASAIDDEILVRTQEIGIVSGVYDENGGLLGSGMQSVLADLRSDTQEALDFETYLGTELWEEFASFRREDTFGNSNYISDGLDNAQLFARAFEFVETAQKEIYKSAMLQHSITSTMNNLLAMPEFKPLVNQFAVGNWIRVKVDGIVYRLRLSEYEIDYSKYDLSVVFTDVREGASSASDISSLLGAIKSMQTSYSSVSRQARAGKESQSLLNNWSAEGFSLTTKIVGGADNQEFIMDSNGFTGREYIPETESYSDEQIKIIANGVYVTDDGWRSVRAGLGKFTFYNPKTKQNETRFGIIADTVVSPIVLTQEVGVYNEDGTVALDEHGLTITASKNNNTNVLTIRKDNGDGTYTPVLSVDANGNLQLSTYAKSMDVEYAVGDSATTAPISGWSTSSPTWTEGKYIWQRTKKTDGNGSETYSNPVCIQGASGSKGDAGKGVSSITEYYCVSSSNTTAPAKASFTTNVQTMTPETPYLWNYELTTYTDSTTSETSMRVIGAYGDTGESGANTAIVNLYKRVSNEKTVTGSPINITDGIDGLPVDNVLVDLDNTIRTDGYSSCTVYQYGKNMASFPELTNANSGGVNYAIESGKLVITGTATASSSPYAASLSTDYDSMPLGEFPAGTYTVICRGFIGKATQDRIVFNARYKDGSTVSGANSQRISGDGVSIADGTGRAVTFTATGTFKAALYIFVASGSSMNCTATIQMERGSSVTDYTDNSTQKYTFDWGADFGVVYGGSLDVTNGILRSELNQDGSHIETPISYRLKSQAISLSGGSGFIWADTGDVTVQYQSDPASNTPSIDWTNSLVYDFTTTSLTSVPSGWFDSVPSGSEPIYITSARASGSGDTDSIPYTEWSAPALLSDGDSGIGSLGKTVDRIATKLNNEYSTTHEMSTAIDVSNEALRATLSETMVEKTEFANYQQEVIGTIEAKATGIVESYGYTSHLERLDTATGNLSKQFESLHGQISRGFIRDPDGNLVFGIAISENLQFDEGTQVIDGLTYYALSKDQTFGLYTATGWQFWINGSKIGWFSSSDGGMLHVINMVTEQLLRLGVHDENDDNKRVWEVSTDGGYGLRYIG